MERWPNQQRALALTIAAIERGVKRLCVTSPTGSGKTQMMLDLIQWAVGKRMPVALYTQRRMLYEQTCRALDRAGIDYGKRAAGHEANAFPDVQMCMTKTELQAVYKREYRKLHNAKLVLIDECFPAGTMISGRPIEVIKIGDTVDTHLGPRKVKAKFRRRPLDGLLRLRFDDGRHLVCTPEHPFWTQHGFIPAKRLTTASNRFVLREGIDCGIL